MTTTLSSRKFNQDTGGAKRAAKSGPVFITDRGEPAYVLLSIKDYRHLVSGSTSGEPKNDAASEPPKKTIIDLLYMPGMEGLADIDLDIPERKGDWGLRVPDFD